MIALVHLVWAPLGLGPPRAFLRSYRAHPAGAEHELVVLLNGLEVSKDTSFRATLEQDLADVPHRLLPLQQPLLDLAAYGCATQLLEHSQICFLNSYSVILADGWLGMLANALDEPKAGLVGATGSWESQAEWARGPLAHRPLQLAQLSAARRDYPRFPNPHVRTTAFLADRARLQQVPLAEVHDKRSAYLLESGYDSVTRRVMAEGLRVLVVSRDGRAHDIPRWPDSGTFRSLSQRNLLVADNRTRDWERASPGLRRRLSRDAWGSRAPIS